MTINANDLYRILSISIDHSLLILKLLYTKKQILSITNISEKTIDKYLQTRKYLIYRDVHFGNFLFFEGKLSGYIDFDLSQRNIGIFDICYFLTGLLAEETDDAFTKTEWLETVKSVFAGYESIIRLSDKEKNAIPRVMECIEILFAAYFISIRDISCANHAYDAFHFIQNCEDDILNVIS